MVDDMVTESTRRSALSSAPSHNTIHQMRLQFTSAAQIATLTGQVQGGGQTAVTPVGYGQTAIEQFANMIRDRADRCALTIAGAMR